MQRSWRSWRDNVVFMETSGHMCSVVMRWAKAREGLQPYKEDEGNKAIQFAILYCIVI